MAVQDGAIVKGLVCAGGLRRRAVVEKLQITPLERLGFVVEQSDHRCVSIPKWEDDDPGRISTCCPSTSL